MGKIYISVGISGSGKSRFAETFCKTSEAIELNADNYRKELGKGVNDQDINKVVFEEIDKAMVISVFISNTNLHAEKIKELAERFPFNDVEVFLMTDSRNKELCWSRIQKDLAAGKDRSNVPREVLERQYNNFIRFNTVSLAMVDNINLYEVDTNSYVTKIN